MKNQLKLDKDRLIKYHTSSVLTYSNNIEVVIKLSTKSYKSYKEYHKHCINLHIPVYNEQCFIDFYKNN